MRADGAAHWARPGEAGDEDMATTVVTAPDGNSGMIALNAATLAVLNAIMQDACQKVSTGRFSSTYKTATGLGDDEAASIVYKLARALQG